MAHPLTAKVLFCKIQFCQVEPAPLWASSYTHLLHQVQDPFSTCRQSKFQEKKKHFYVEISLDAGPVFTDQETRKENSLGGASSLVGQLLHPSLVQSPRSIQRMQTAKFQKKEKHSYFEIGLMQDQSLLHRSETQEEILLGGASSLVGQLLHPSLVQSPRSIQRMQTAKFQKKEKHSYFEIGLMQDQSLLHRSETQEEILLGGASSLVGQLLHPSLVQSPRSIQRMQTVQIPKKKNTFCWGDFRTHNKSPIRFPKFQNKTIKWSTNKPTTDSMQNPKFSFYCLRHKHLRVTKFKFE